MLATAGQPPAAAWAVAQSIPSMTSESEPLPSRSTRTGWTTACRATPKVLPATVPATCVPWPWSSSMVSPTAL